MPPNGLGGRPQYRIISSHGPTIKKLPKPLHAKRFGSLRVAQRWLPSSLVFM
jgi:hypothetical protein